MNKKSSRIPEKEYKKLLEMVTVSKSKSEKYKALKSKLNIPEITNPSIQSLNDAALVLKELFFDNEFNILDAIVAETGHGPSSDNDTHYRGRVLERVLNGTFTGESAPDFAYGDLKLIETKNLHKITQVMTVGTIFNKSNREYKIVEDYYQSNFYKKVKQCLIMSYLKEGKQLGMTPNNIITFNIDDEEWANKLKEDWESIRDQMKEAITEYNSGKRQKKASGICKSDTSGTGRPNGYLGIRSDSIVFTAKFFELISKKAKIIKHK
jgi:hypothetical protein